MAKYVDLSATIQVIGCIYQNPSLLDDVIGKDSVRVTITE